MSPILSGSHPLQQVPNPQEFLRCLFGLLPHTLQRSNPIMKQSQLALILFAIYTVVPNAALAQPPKPTVLIIDAANTIEYLADVADPEKFGRLTALTPSTSPLGFPFGALIGDIIAVNGQPAKGATIGQILAVGASPSPKPGFAIADISRSSFRNTHIEILKADGTPVGTLMLMGMNSGATTIPGAPRSLARANYTIVGGTGAFLGMRGQAGTTLPLAGIPSARLASIVEDPAVRRVNGNGGGILRWVLQLIPMTTPQVAMLPSGPAITHSSDFVPVSAARPAAQGELLSIFATGLGPTTLSLDPGEAFPATPSAPVNSPVEVLVNGKPAELLGAVGFPGAVDGYQINFRLPADTPKGTATIQLTAAWVNGSSVTIQVQ